MSSDRATQSPRHDIEWVVFDLGRVVVAETERLADLADLLGTDLNRLSDAYSHHRLEYDRLSDETAYWAAVAGHSGARPPTPDQVRALRRVDQEGWSVVRADSLALIEDLHAAGYGLAVCSNAPSSMARFVELQPWAERFQHFVFSGDLAAVKPEPAIYDRVLELTGSSPDRTVFLDDLPENVAGARAAGWHAFVFTDAMAARRDLATLGVL